MKNGPLGAALLVLLGPAWFSRQRQNRSLFVIDNEAALHEFGHLLVVVGVCGAVQRMTHQDHDYADPLSMPNATSAARISSSCAVIAENPVVVVKP